MILPQVTCNHWSADKLSGVCALGKYGGRPSAGVCAKCPECKGVQEPPKPPVKLDVISPERLLQIESYKEACRACTFWLGSFEKVRGMEIEGYTKCDRCNCASKRVSLFSGYCREDNW